MAKKRLSGKAETVRQMESDSRYKAKLAGLPSDERADEARSFAPHQRFGADGVPTGRKPLHTKKPFAPGMIPSWDKDRN